ncbi:unnamed protein product [Meloidogyne enterolobii]|uniref:Uncharacterized protein n=1 Tax=Meloidogyne enterolobii TaxID=390850 RepID=A0ACB1AS14_MELEN
MTQYRPILASVYRRSIHFSHFFPSLEVLKQYFSAIYFLLPLLQLPHLPSTP